MSRLLLGFKTRPRIIVADDDREMRALLRQVLKEEGYEVVEAGDGEQLAALLQIDRDRPNFANADAIISDIRMPRSSGLELLSAMRAADWTIPVILITGFPDAAVEEESARLGAAAVFSKPFALEELVSTMRNLLTITT